MSEPSSYKLRPFSVKQGGPATVQFDTPASGRGGVLPIATVDGVPTGGRAAALKTDCAYDIRIEDGKVHLVTAPGKP